MARLNSKLASDSESDVPATKSTRKEAASRSNADASEDERGQNTDGEPEDSEESEFEIEDILDAKRGIFPQVSFFDALSSIIRTQLPLQGRMGYLCKWKGYPDSENSWVDERDIV